jgi:light-regulated signal transduction histidine kinase (bacteriophytochrome)
MQVVLENLLGNAWKFTAKVAQANVEFGSHQTSEGTVYFIRDNGAGFDMAYGQKLFQPFQRLHTEAQFSGTGIGLATVHRIINRHGGRVWAEGTVGSGATFSFTVPPARPEDLA